MPAGTATRTITNALLGGSAGDHYVTVSYTAGSTTVYVGIAHLTYVSVLGLGLGVQCT